MDSTEKQVLRKGMITAHLGGNTAYSGIIASREGTALLGGRNLLPVGNGNQRVAQGIHCLGMTWRARVPRFAIKFLFIPVLVQTTLRKRAGLETAEQRHGS